MSQFSRLPLRQKRLMPRHTLLTHYLRMLLALGLASFLFMAPLRFGIVSGQEPSVPNPDLPSKLKPYDHFIVFRNAAGEVECRDATLSERQQMDKVNPKGLRQINHLPEDSVVETTNVETPENDLPAHLTIILRATAQLEANAPAKAAFIRAVQAWESFVKSPITVYLDADFGSTSFGEPWDDPSTLGATASPTVPNGATYQEVRSRLIAGASTQAEASVYNTLPLNSFPIDVPPGFASDMSVSSSIGRAIGLLVPTAQPTDASARIGFNSAHPFDFDPSNGISGLDFEAVATHEIGHALGFTSRSGSGANTVPTVWDLFRFRQGTTAATFPSAPRIMTIGGPTGNSLQFYFFPGAVELGLSTGGPSAVTTNNGDGNQSSHWKLASLNGSFIGIMDPRLPQNVRRTIQANDLRALDSFGYNRDNSNPPPPPPPAPPVPPNNNFANAQILNVQGCAGSATGTNVGGNHESGEPSHDSAVPPDPGGSSVWYRWTAPTNGTVTITTKGSTYDTMLGVYTGNAFGSLTTIGKNDDEDLGVILSSKITFNAVAGTVYRIAVDGWGGETGSIVINWFQGGCNDTMTAQFSAGSYQVSEGAGSVQIRINRSNTSQAATVTYATSDTAGLTSCGVVNGAASERCDYQTTVGTARFAVGETSKVFNIPIIDDARNEGNESFAVSVKASTGALLKAPVTAIVTIQDNATPTVNPIETPQFFITQQYIDFLGRLPDSVGLANWMQTLTNCPNGGFGEFDNPHCDRVHVSAGFYLSDEFRGRGYWAYRFYEVAFNRRPNYAEFVPDMAQVGGAQSPESEVLSKNQYQADFVQRSEFTSLNGLTNAAFVNTIEANAEVDLDNTALTNQLNGGKSRAQLLREIVESKAVEDRFFIRAFVAMQYFGYLRRDPDTVGYNNWVTTLTANPSDFRHMIFGFIYSPEYRARFGNN